ncbi:MAG: hypothetical protein DHS20C18_49830 [Saprospiraceae bacterium]|nr:MAG: hypothetical protein DHS20C18_49830 [Saprospiraceae bacterium]
MTKIALTEDLKDLYVIINGTLSAFSLSGNGVFVEIDSGQPKITAITGSPTKKTILKSASCQVTYDGNEDLFHTIGELDLVLNISLPGNSHVTENPLMSPLSVVSVEMGSRVLIFKHDGTDLIISEEV